MLDEIYKNGELYYNFMKDFLQRKITPWEFRTKYSNQRCKDLDQDKNKGYTFEKYEEKLRNLSLNEKKFKDEYFDLLNYEGMSILKDYEEGAKVLDIQGELFFMGIWNFLDCPIIEFYPSENEGFDPKVDTDEQTLTKIVHAAFNVLERNKDRWVSEAQKFEEKPQKDNGQRI